MSGEEYRSVQQARQVLAVFFEHLGDDFAARPVLYVFLVHAVLDCCGTSFFIIVDFVERNSGYLDNGLRHIDLVPRRSNIEALSFVGDNRRTVYRHRALIHNLFHQVHHIFQVAVCHIRFHGGEFRAVVLVHTFVTENLAQLVYSVQSADNQSLQRKLQGDSQLQVEVQGVVVGVERTSVCTAGDGLENRGLYFQESVILFQYFPNGLYNLRTVVEGFPNIFVHDQVYITLTISQIDILKAAPLIRQHLQGFCQKGQLLSVNGYLVGTGLEDKTAQAHDITDVVGLEDFVLIDADIISLDIALNSALLILYIEERRLAHDSFSHNTAGDGNFLAFHGFEVLLDVLAVCSYIVRFLYKWISAHITKFLQFLSADFSLFADFFCGQFHGLGSIVIIVTHVVSFFFSFLQCAARTNFL